MSADTCGFKEELSAYLDGELDGGRQNEVVEHLGSCTDCAKECAGLKSTSALMSRCTESIPQVDLWAAIAGKMPAVCELIQEDLSAYLDGELIAPSKEGVADHLNACTPCHEKFQGLSKVNTLISQGLELSNAVPIDIWSGLATRLNEDCGIIAEELSSFYDREVTPDRHRAVTTHLLECSHCREELTSITSNSELLQTLYQPTLPEDFDLWPAIKQKISVVPLAPKDRRRKTFATRRLYGVAAVVAAGVLAAIAGFVNFHSVSTITPVTAESYLIESALGEPAELAEAVVYEN